MDIVVTARGLSTVAFIVMPANLVHMSCSLLCAIHRAIH